MPVSTDSREYLTLQEASERFGLAVRTLRAWRAKRLITRYERNDGLAVVDAAEIVSELERRKEVRKIEDHG